MDAALSSSGRGAGERSLPAARCGAVQAAFSRRPNVPLLAASRLRLVSLSYLVKVLTNRKRRVIFEHDRYPDGSTLQAPGAVLAREFKYSTDFSSSLFY